MINFAGILYAMGLALIMEGIMSGCYHVCPNHTNFQFDTAFMYTISILILMKIYQVWPLTQFHFVGFSQPIIM